jgi:hypothetical protein
MAIMIALASIAYGTARFYSPALIHYVVKQSLIQKAPPEISAMSIERQLETYLSTTPNRSLQMQRLLRLSTGLEKVQHLTLKDWDRLFSEEESEKIKP